MTRSFSVAYASVQASFDGFGVSLGEVEEGAIDLLRLHEPPDGYYLAFSGGKDSCVIKELAIRAGVRFEARYNNTTIDPPELVRFIKQYHPDVEWNQPKHGNMLHRIANAPKVPPTRSVRWCCSEYKESGGVGRVKIMGVRAAESPKRRHGWKEVSEDMSGSQVICPIVHWSTEVLWLFIRSNAIPYCSLYDEGFDRIGCIGCPLASSEKQAREFDRWPNYKRNWKRAVIANWEKWKDVPNSKTGEPRYHAKFKTGEEFWEWWITAKSPDIFRDDCQSGSLWTNDELVEIS
jgi:phosphoadenosine phosphosulfate reductase